MNDHDFEKFSEAWSAAFELCSRGKVPSPGAINLAFEALRDYPIDQITAALTRHVRSEAGRYGLTVSDLVVQIDGPAPTVDRVIGAAMKPSTALAVMCRIEMGSWNLSTWDRHQLRPMAERCIAMIPEWRKRLAAGELLEHERAAMERHGVSLDNVRQLDGGVKRLEGGAG